MARSTSTYSQSELRGIARAEEELAKLPPPLDHRFHAPDGTPWCRYMVGSVECINEHTCLNPRHNIPTCRRCGWQWDGTGAPPNACRRCKCTSCGWQWPAPKERPCTTCTRSLYLEPADPKDPWNVDVNIPLDRWNRYILPHPETGKEMHWTRMTTAADTLEDKYGIIDHKARMVAYGMGISPDLVNLAMSAEGVEDKDVLNAVVKQAEQRAAAERKANIGTTLHKLTQKIDRGDSDVRIPEIHRDRIIRYKTAVAQHQLKFPIEWIEAIVCIPDLGLCGSTDRGAEWPHSPEPVIYDLKTGSLDYAKVKIAQQLGGYANSKWVWDKAAKQWLPLPPFNREIALVMWLPAETDEEPKLYKVNIAEGWRILNQSMEVRSLRSGRGKHLFTEITADALPTPAANREETLRERVRDIVNEPAAKQALLALWPRDMPTLTEGGLTRSQLDQIESWCEQVERDFGI